MRAKIKKLIIYFGYKAYKIIRTPIIWYWKIFKIQTRGVRIMLVHQNKIVLVRHWYNSLWVMPGGGIHKYETPEQAAVREIKEELGINNVQLDYMLGVYQNKNGGKNDLIYCYVVKLENFYTFQKNRFNFEIADIIWTYFDQLPAGTSEATKRRVQEYLGSQISKNIRMW
jgi:8-oxo-dGTP pyrophosphatase MutT (NUDIX family)